MHGLPASFQGAIRNGLCLRASPCFKVDMIDDKDGLQTNGTIEVPQGSNLSALWMRTLYRADPRYFPAQMQF
jgi:hypothetical protein